MISEVYYQQSCIELVMVSQCPDCSGVVETVIGGSTSTPTATNTCVDCGKDVFSCVHCGESITDAQTAVLREQYHAAMTSAGGSDGRYVEHRYCEACEGKAPKEITVGDEELEREMSANQYETLQEFDVPIPYVTFVTGPGDSRVIEFYEEQEYRNPDSEQVHVSDKWMMMSCNDTVELYVMYDKAPYIEKVGEYEVEGVTDAVNDVLQSIATCGNMSGVPNKK